jgi:vacuolar-type H+-ATPase catalytic subunit A/Vma1
MRIADMPMTERISRYMTYSGACTASACGAAQEISTYPQTTMTLADFGVIVGIAVGVLGLSIQAYCMISRRIEERKLTRLELAIKRAELKRLACASCENG